MTQDLYRNRDFIPDFDELLAETAARSREFARQADIRADIPYGHGSRERFDLVLPDRLAQGAPVHMFIHGGYWRAGNKEDHHLMAAPALSVGAAAAIVSYDLMPGARLGTLVQQIRAAARTLHTVAGQHGLDAARLTVSGHSAGAHLASYLAAVGPQETVEPVLPEVQGLLLISGIYDLSGIPDSFLKHEAKMTPEEAAAWSPLSSRHVSGPQRVIMVSEKDTAPFHEQAAALHTLLGGNEGRAELRVEPDLNHLSIVLALSNPDSACSQRLCELIETA